MPFINDMLGDITSGVGSATDKTADVAHADSSGLSSRFQFSPAGIMQRLRARIIGQEAALAEIEGILNLIKADIGDPRRPLHVALFLGPTGVGKTELVRVLAEAIHGSADACCRIDMNTLAQAHYAAAIIGAPPGYVGSREGATLLDSERIQGSFSRPGIALFDEIEKADKEVIRALLNVFDHGQLTLSSGAKVIDFRNTIVFMTSNLAAREVGRYEDSLRRGWRRLVPCSAARCHRRVHAILGAAMQRTFDPEFINRIDSITLFNRMDADKLDALIELELARLNTRLARSGWTIGLDQGARSWLKQRGFDRRFGARSLARSFRQEVTVVLAEKLVHSGRVQDATRSRHLVGRRAAEGIRFHASV